MRIEVLGEHSISAQTRSYAEYRLFAVLSGVVDTGRVRRARLVLRRRKHRPASASVSCTVTVEIDTEEVLRIRTTGIIRMRRSITPWSGSAMGAVR